MTGVQNPEHTQNTWADAVAYQTVPSLGRQRQGIPGASQLTRPAGIGAL